MLQLGIPEADGIARWGMPTPPPNVWTGSESTDWFDPANWSTNEIPTSLDHVIIPAGSIVNIPIGMTGVAALLTIDLTATFTVDGMLDMGE